MARMVIISTSKIVQIWPVVVAVALNMCLTLSIWTSIYGMETESRTFLLFNSRGNNTTGSDFYDGMINGLVCLGLLALMSFIMLTLALYNFRKLLQIWLVASCVLINFFISAALFNDILKKAGPLIGDRWASLLVAPISITYGVVGCVAYFLDVLPLIFFQVFVVFNCSMVSLYYLRTLPDMTIWFILVGITLWDLFAVLAPFGPLRRVAEKATDYSEVVLRMLMFHANTGGGDNNGDSADNGDQQLVDVSPESESSVSTSSTTAIEEYVRNRPPASPDGEEEVLRLDLSIPEKVGLNDDEDDVDEKEMEEANALSTSTATNSDTPTLMVREEAAAAVAPLRQGRTAHDALQDTNVTRLGMGDFVFYSVLVGKAAVNGSVWATLAAVVGVLVGLIITLTAFSDYDDSIPALPVPTVFGMLLHFTMLLVIEPLAGALIVTLCSLWNGAAMAEPTLHVEL